MVSTYPKYLCLVATFSLMVLAISDQEFSLCLVHVGAQASDVDCPPSLVFN